MKMKLMLFFAFAICIGFVSGATECNLNAVLINQDPYPAIPGDYVNVVFQLNGVGNPACGKIDFELIRQFPFSLDEDVSAKTTINSGTYARNFESFAIIPYKVRVAESALDGTNLMEVHVSSGGVTNVVEEFEVEIDDVKTDFEISIKDYVSSANTLTFEILNIGESDAEALTIEIPKQGNVAVKGSNRNIVGSLDSNEDTTFSFEAIPSVGEIKLNILYSDEINVRRSLEKTVYYEPEYFTDRARDAKSSKTTTYLVLVTVIVVIGWIWWKRRKKRKAREAGHHLHHHK